MRFTRNFSRLALSKGFLSVIALGGLLMSVIMPRLPVMSVADGRSDSIVLPLMFSVNERDSGDAQISAGIKRLLRATTMLFPEPAPVIEKSGSSIATAGIRN